MPRGIAFIHATYKKEFLLQADWLTDANVPLCNPFSRGISTMLGLNGSPRPASQQNVYLFNLLKHVSHHNCEPFHKRLFHISLISFLRRAKLSVQLYTLVPTVSYNIDTPGAQQQTQSTLPNSPLSQTIIPLKKKKKKEYHHYYTLYCMTIYNLLYSTHCEHSHTHTHIRPSHHPLRTVHPPPHLSYRMYTP